MRYCACLEEPMPADRPRTPRTLLIPDHLWDVFASMASEMGADRDALVNQAMYTFARLNGFLVPSDLRNVSSADALSSSHAGKVSREHAAIVRDGTEYFIEDLGSSNGTWYDKRRINRQKIQDGDEYYICSEKLSCVFQ